MNNDLTGIADREALEKAIRNNEIVLLKGKKNTEYVGKGLKLKINASVGVSDVNNYNTEIDKIKKLSQMDCLPDIMMDLSILDFKKPIYKTIQKEIGCPVGVVPVYTCFNEKEGISKNKLLETIEEQAENGVAFMTMHFTAGNELYKRSLNRNISVISRGGSLVLRDLYLNNRKENVFLEYIDEICKILRKHSVVISIGTTYRPSTLYDALDNVNLDEIARQKELVHILRKKQIKVIMEGIGHISLKHLPEYIKNIRDDFYIPFMPLGPIVTDRAVGWDHIASAIGVSQMALLNGIDIANAVTREEHTGGIPTVDSIYEAIMTAKVAVNAIEDVKHFEKYNKRQTVKRRNCLNSHDTLGCDRCKNECPFILEFSGIN